MMCAKIGPVLLFTGLVFVAVVLPVDSTNVVGDVFCTDQCVGTGIRCTDAYTYQLCMNYTDYAVSLSSAKKCPDGAICDTRGAFPCKIGTITTTTAAPPPTTQPACSGPGKYPTNSCNTYFQCIQMLWWWQLETQTCPDGQNFDPNTLECVPKAQYSCGVTVTTESSTLPTCSWFGNLPGPTSNQYYECVFIWFTFQPQLRTCPDGQYFNTSSANCQEV